MVPNIAASNLLPVASRAFSFLFSCISNKSLGFGIRFGINHFGHYLILLRFQHDSSCNFTIRPLLGFSCETAVCFEIQADGDMVVRAIAGHIEGGFDIYRPNASSQRYLLSTEGETQLQWAGLQRVGR